MRNWWHIRVIKTNSIGKDYHGITLEDVESFISANDTALILDISRKTKDGCYKVIFRR